MRYPTWILTGEGSATVVTLAADEMATLTFVGYNAMDRAEDAEEWVADGGDPDVFKNTTQASVSFDDIESFAVTDDGIYLDFKVPKGVEAFAIEAGSHGEAREMAEAVSDKIGASESREPISVTDALMLPGLVGGAIAVFGFFLTWAATGPTESHRIARPRRRAMAEGLLAIAESLGPMGVAVVAVMGLIACAAWGYHRLEDRPLQSVWTLD